MQVTPNYPKKEYNFKGSVILSNCFPVSPGSDYDNREEGGLPGMFVYFKSKGVYEYFPEKFKAVIASYVPYKLAWNAIKGQTNKGQPPFCSSILEDTSLRWNKEEGTYKQGPLCFGDSSKEIPPCPLFDNSCIPGVLVYAVTENKTILKLFLKRRDMTEFLEKVKQIGNNEFVYIRSSKEKNKKSGKNYYRVLIEETNEKYKEEEYTEIKQSIEEDIDATVLAQRGEYVETEENEGGE